MVSVSQQFSSRERYTVLETKFVSEVHERLDDIDLNAALAGALEKTFKATGRDIGGIFLIDEETGRPSYHVGRRLSGKYSRSRMKLGEYAAESVQNSGKPQYFIDVSLRLAAKLKIKTDLKAFTALPMKSHGTVNGILIIADLNTRPFSENEKRVLEGISRHAGWAIESARLRRDIQNKDRVLRELLDEMLSIEEDERRRIARELHDEISQVLASLSANLEVAMRLLPRGTGEVRSILKKSQSLSNNILEETHKLIYQLRPTLLDDLGLVPATAWLVESTLEASGIRVDFGVAGSERRLPAKIETALYRVIQEVTTNITKHAHAHNVAIMLKFKPDRIVVRIYDDGCGFDVTEAETSAQRPRGLGLIGMRERVELIKGKIAIYSRPDGGGTTIEIDIPTKGEVDGKN